MASGACSDTFKALRRCVAAAMKDSSGRTTTTTQPLPCLDAADSIRKCMEEKAGNLKASGAGASKGEADANANRRLVLDFMAMQKAMTEMELAPPRDQGCAACFRRSMASGSCNDTFLALDECVVSAAKKDGGSGMTTAKLPLPCLEVAASLKKCMEEHTDQHSWILDHIAASAGEREADDGKAVGLTTASHRSSLVAILKEADARVPR